MQAVHARVTAPDPEGARRSRREGPQTSRPAGADQPRTGQLLVTGIALSIDNLAIGFALGVYHVNLAAAAVIIGAVSVLSLPKTSFSLVKRHAGTRG